MDVTSLLNLKAARHQEQHQNTFESTPASSELSTLAISSTTLSTPSSEKSTLFKETSNYQTTRRRMPWDAGGYSLPLTLDTNKTPMHSSSSMFHRDSPFDRSTSGSSYDLPSETSHSRASSLSSTCFDMSTSNNATPMTSTHPGR